MQGSRHPWAWAGTPASGCFSLTPPLSLESRGKKVQKEGKISYADFVWFLISEEDKKTPTRWVLGPALCSGC